MRLHHARVKMAGAAGHDVLHRKPELGQPPGVVLRLEVTRQHRHASSLVHALQRLLQQQCLAGSWRSDQVHARDSLPPISFTQLFSENLIFAQDFLFDFDSAHSSTSMYAMSNSSPLMHWVANSPHFGHCGSYSV